MMYKLIRPTNETIEQYNRFWNINNVSIDPINWKIQLFEGDDLVDMTNYISESKFREYGEGDRLIYSLLEADDIPGFLGQINSTYHTRLSVSKLKGLDKKWFTEDNIDDFVDICKKEMGKKAYSFASKVYSFLYPELFPIIDSYAATLLWEYMSNEYKMNHQYSDWGYYRKYKDAYNVFKEESGIDKKTYKETDRFLWTYAVVLREFWRKQGVLTFASVEYKGREKE